MFSVVSLSGFDSSDTIWGTIPTAHPPVGFFFTVGDHCGVNAAAPALASEPSRLKVSNPTWPVLWLTADPLSGGFVKVLNTETERRVSVQLPLVHDNPKEKRTAR